MMRNPFRRSKPAAIAIAKDVHLSVLAARASLPSPFEIANPDGAEGAVVGMAVPLAEGAANKDRLRQPLGPGRYAVASKDRKTMLNMAVMSKEAMRFDPQVVLASPLAATLDDDARARLQSTWTILQVLIVTYDPDVYPALDFFLDVVQRLGTLTDGVIADPLAERYVAVEHLRQIPRADPRVDARDHISVRREGEGGWATRGMRKFGLPEYEAVAVPEDCAEFAATVLLGLAQTALLGSPLREGQMVGTEGKPFAAYPAPARADGVPALTLLAEDGTMAWRAWREVGI